MCYLEHQTGFFSSFGGATRLDPTMLNWKEKSSLIIKLSYAIEKYMKNFKLLLAYLSNQYLLHVINFLKVNYNLITFIDLECDFNLKYQVHTQPFIS